MAVFFVATLAKVWKPLTFARVTECELSEDERLACIRVALWYNCFNRMMQDLQHQLDQKTAQLAALREIGRANGVLMRREGLSEE